MALWYHLRRAARSLAFASRVFRQDDEIGRALCALAERERRPENEIAADLLSIALARRQAAEVNLQYWHMLTPREQEVTALVCLNLTNAEIAERLVVSPETIKTHVKNVLYKLHLHSKSELRQLLSDWDFSAWGAGKESDHEESI
jgi:DNA-binding CsgD family transcriptional regulator